jgi:hypothetical protein
MNRKNQRILWLLNHTTLRSFEVPLLESLGFEVFTCKIYPDEPGNRSASVDYSFDRHLSIPKQDLDILNSFNFYTCEIYPAIRKIINEYFSYAVVAYVPFMVDQIIQNFKGHILLRAFGLTSDKWTYYDFLKEICGSGFSVRFAEVSNRFWFAQSYPNLYLIEPEPMKSRVINLPIGLPDFIIEKANSWHGTKRQIMFVCPDINVYKESKLIYKNFKRYFKKMPHVIVGNQRQTVKDPFVTGYLSREEYYNLIRESKVMFYHSTLPRHIHYHPVEAICFGMPLIFMKQGMLGYLGGANLPGACDNFHEAAEKVQRVLNGDEAFIKQVRVSQKILLDWFSRDNCLTSWQSFFKRIKDSVTLHTKTKKNIGILVRCSSRRSRAFDFAKEVLLEISHIPEYNLIFAYPDSVVLMQEEVEDLKKSCIKQIPIRWKSISAQEVKVAQEFSGYSKELVLDEYLVPEDGMDNLHYCDLWIIVDELMDKPIAPVKKHIYTILWQNYCQFDLYQRLNYPYNLIQAADAVISEGTLLRNELIRLFALPKSKTFVFPVELDICGTIENTNVNSVPYFVFDITDICIDEIAISFNYLSAYYKNGGELNALIIVPTENKEKIAFIEEMIISREIPVEKIYVKNIYCPSEIKSIVKKADFIWVPKIPGWENQCLQCAINSGVPVMGPKKQWLADILETYGGKLQPLNHKFMNIELLDPMIMVVIGKEYKDNIRSFRNEFMGGVKYLI